MFSVQVCLLKLITNFNYNITLFFSLSKAMEAIVLVHGGAGEIPSSRVQPKLRDCRLAAKRGYEVLQRGGSVLDAVEVAVNVMEDSEVFNASIKSL